MSDGEVLKLCRVATNITARRLADVSGLCRETISRLELGRTPLTPKLLAILANAYHVELVPFTRLFRQLADHDIEKVSDYQDALMNILLLWKKD